MSLYQHQDPNLSLISSDLFSVRDHVIVVTGGGTGLGRCMTEGFVINGAKVYIVGRRKEVLDQTVDEIEREYKGREGVGKVIAIHGDISTKAGAKSIADQLSEKEEKIDVLVNNAATQKPWRVSIDDPWKHHDADTIAKYVWEGVEDEDFNITNTVNINGPYFMTAALVPLLRKSDIKSVIVISSIAAHANQRATSTLVYGTSKAATSHLATMMAGRLSPIRLYYMNLKARLGIRVNTIAPGTFPSDLTTFRDEEGNVKLVDKAAKAAIRTPSGRVGYKHEIVGPALLLASRAGGFMNNAMLAVDGGRNMVAGCNDGVPFPPEAF